MSNKDIVTYLPSVADKLNCELNFALPDFDKIAYHMIINKTQLGNYPCPCTIPINGVYSTFCPCKDWVQKCKNGTAKKGDKCHCEILEKV